MPRSAPHGRPHADLFAAARFDGFGPSRFHPPDESPGGHRIRTKDAHKLRQRVRSDAPKRPGVYGMLDRLGRVIYIGKAKHLRTRLLCYFRDDARNPKAAKIIRHTRALLWEHCETEFAALLRELELIQMFRPRFNVLGQPGQQRHCYVCVGRPPALTVYVGKKPAATDVASYGPFVARGMVEAAVGRLADVFALRDCKANQPMAFADQAHLFDGPRSPGCLRYELGTCLAPCAGHCTRRQYSAAVRAAVAFLDGKDTSLLGRLKREMTAAAVAMNYEKASAVRDKLRELEWLDQRLTLLRKARDRSTFVLPATGHDGRPLWFVVHRGQVSSVVRPPACADSTARVGALLAETAADRPPAGPFACHPVDSVLLVAAWLRKNPADRAALRPVADVIGELAVEM